MENKIKRALFLDISIPTTIKKDTLINNKYNSESLFIDKKFSLFLRFVIKSIQKNHNLKVYLSLPLEVEDELPGFLQNSEIEIKRLIQEGRLEFVVKPNYQIRYELVNENVLDLDIIASESLLGHYFGDKRNFEGDQAIVLRDLETIYLPNISGSSKYFPQLNDLSYRFVLGNFNKLYSYYGMNLVPLSYNLMTLFNEPVTLDIVNDVITRDSNSDFQIWYLNLGELYIQYGEVLSSNLDNLLYLLDKNAQITFSFLSEISNRLQVEQKINVEEYSALFDREKVEPISSIQKIQKELSDKFIDRESKAMDEELWAIPFISKTGIEKVDNTNLFNKLLLSILSTTINEQRLSSDKFFTSELVSKIEELNSLAKKLSLSKVVSNLEDLSLKINQILHK